MGRPMAARILAAGNSLTVHDLRKEAAAPLIDKGARWAASPREVAAGCAIVFSCLPMPKDVEQLVNGPGGLKAGWKKGDIYVDMSTNSPTTMRKIAEEAKPLGVAVLDAPVSGGTKGAEVGTLAIMVGGPAETFEAVKPVLGTMGTSLFRVGDVGCGNVAKLVNNMISLACNSITAEGFVLGVKGGIDPLVLCDIVKAGTGNNWSVNQYGSTVFKRNFEPGFRVSLAYKDIGLAVALGEEYGVPLPVGASVKKDLGDAVAAGLGDKAVNSVILPLEDAAGVTVRPKP